MLISLRRQGLWPPLVPSPVLVESLTGHPGRDAVTNRFLKACDVIEVLTQDTAGRAAQLRAGARRGSAVDAIVVALAEPGGTVMTGDTRDLGPLADRARNVGIVTV